MFLEKLLLNISFEHLKFNILFFSLCAKMTLIFPIIKHNKQTAQHGSHIKMIKNGTIAPNVNVTSRRLSIIFFSFRLLTRIYSEKYTQQLRQASE